MPSTKMTKEQYSERMKRAWETRRENMAKAKGGTAPATEAAKPLKVQIPSATVQDKVTTKLAEEFFKYLDFAIDQRDSGVLTTEKFRAILANVRPWLTLKK